jgi:hypothetical protein
MPASMSFFFDTIFNAGTVCAILIVATCAVASIELLDSKLRMVSCT